MERRERRVEEAERDRRIRAVHRDNHHKSILSAGLGNK